MFKLYTSVIVMFICGLLTLGSVHAYEDERETETFDDVKESLWVDGVYENMSEDIDIDNIIKDLEQTKINQVMPEELYLTYKNL